MSSLFRDRRVIGGIIVVVLILMVSGIYFFNTETGELGQETTTTSSTEPTDTDSDQELTVDGGEIEISSDSGELEVSSASEDTTTEDTASDADAVDPSPAVEEPTEIVLDIVRVEKDGAVLVAGRYNPETIINLNLNNRVIGSTTANVNGEWVLESTENLEPGSHLLQISARADENSEVILDDEIITVHIPENNAEEVLVVINSTDNPSRIVQIPSPEEPDIEQEEVEEVTEAVEEVVKPEILAIRAVETEGNTVFIAGEGYAGDQIFVYIGGDLVGSTRPNSQNRWLLEVQRNIPNGRHEIRAQILDEVTKEVKASVSVVFEKVPESVILRPLVAVKGTTGSGAPGTTSETLVAALPNVIIRKGDNLWTISRKLYGRGIRYTTIYQANKSQIDDPDLIFPGQVFLTPERDLGWTEE